MKRKIVKRAAAMLLTMVMVCASLAGCSGKDQKGTGNETVGKNAEESSEKRAMGRFLEEEVDTDIVFGNIMDMKKLENGTLRIIGSNADDEMNSVWDSKDQGANWEKVYDFPAEIQDSDEGYADRGALSADGKAVCVYNKNEHGSGIKPILYLLDQNGSAAPLAFELPASKGETAQGKMIMGITFAGSDQLLVKDETDKIFQINIGDGSVKHTNEFDGSIDTHQVYAAGKKMIVFTSTEALVYDTETGEQLPLEESLQQGLAEAGLFHSVDSMDGGESIYCLSGGGLYHYKFGGSVMEQLIDSKMNSMGAPAFYPIALTMVDEENFLVAANDSNSSSPTGVALLKYSYDADIPAKPDKELRVYSLYENREMRQSISRFQKEHADIFVNYQAAMSEENGMNVSDALKTLTTEIMAGKGPDLMILDGMPVETYIEKGILKDLSSLIGEEGSYFEDILKTYEDEQGQLCAAPARFMIPMIQAGSAYYTPGEDFDTFTGRKDALANMEPRSVVEKFWYTCGAAWRKSDGTLDAAKITEFLTKLKDAYGTYDHSLDDEETGVHMTMDGNTEEIGKLSFSHGNFELAFGRINVNIGLFSNMDYGMMTAVNKKLDHGDYGLMPGQAEHVFVPAMILGINSKSSQTETAEAFVKYLFSQDSQNISQSGGLPVEKEAFCSVIDGHQCEGKENLFCVGGVEDEILDYAMEPTPEEEIKKLTDLVESLNTPAFRDDVIKDVVAEQGEKVLKGEINPKEATDAIIQKVNIYLAE